MNISSPLSSSAGGWCLAVDLGSGAAKCALVHHVAARQGEEPPREGVAPPLRPRCGRLPQLRYIDEVLFSREYTALLGHAVEEEAAASATAAAAGERTKNDDISKRAGNSNNNGTTTTSNSNNNKKKRRYIPPHAIQMLLGVLTRMFSDAREAWLSRRCGGGDDGDGTSFDDVPKLVVCTAVFRETANGKDVLKTISKLFGISKMKIATALEEGRLGYLSALASVAVTKVPFEPSSSPPSTLPTNREQIGRGWGGRSLVVWDSGGASFQLTTTTPTTTAATTTTGVSPSHNKNGERLHQQQPRYTSLPYLTVFEGSWGSSKAVMASVRDVQRKPLGASSLPSPNPMSRDDVTRTIAWISNDLTQRSSSVSSSSEDAIRQAIVAAAASGEAVVGIGGPTSAFRMCSLLLKRSENITASALHEALEHLVVGAADQELSDLGFPQEQMVGPKVCLVIAVMNHFKMHRFTYVPTIGNTLGIATAMEFLFDDDAEDVARRVPSSSL